MSISAMKQALEALENYVNVVTSSNDPKDFGGVVDGGEPARQAITALRQAIAEAEKQEPVAWMWKDGTLTSDPDFADGTWTPLFTAPVHASDTSQERVDETPKRKHEFDCPRCGHCCPEREWVGLTHDEAKQLVERFSSDPLYLLYQNEAKLKEKNTP